MVGGGSNLIIGSISTAFRSPECSNASKMCATWHLLCLNRGELQWWWGRTVLHYNVMCTRKARAHVRVMQWSRELRRGWAHKQNFHEMSNWSVLQKSSFWHQWHSNVASQPWSTKAKRRDRLLRASVEVTQEHWSGAEESKHHSVHRLRQLWSV